MRRKNFGTSIMHVFLFFFFFFSRDLHTKQKKQSGWLKIQLVIYCSRLSEVATIQLLYTRARTCICFKRPLPCRANDWTGMVKIV